MSSVRNKNTLKMVQLSLLGAIIIVLSVVPGLGYIPLGFINATTLHIPVIIGAIVLGPKEGAILGGIFGVTSMLKNTFMPNVTSFVFTPFYSVDGTSGNLWSIVISIVPRILIGVLAGLVFKAIATKDKNQIIACVVSGLVGSLTNTILVMTGIYVFFGEQYAAAKETVLEGFFGWIAVIIGTAGIPEAIVAAIIATLVAKPLLIAMKK